MDSRTPCETISTVVDQLKIFTLAEIYYILQEDTRISSFDIHRIKKITDGVRYRFDNDHTYEQVSTLIYLLSDTFKQTLPVQNELSFSYVFNRQLHDPIIVPFSSVCSVCKRALSASETKQRSIKIYCVNGSVVTGKVLTFVCYHLNNTYFNDSSPVTMYPNFIHQDDKHVYSYESLHFGLYVYVGGDVCLERALIDRFTAEFIYHGLSIHGFVNSLNQEAHNKKHLQFSAFDPHIISNILFRYLYLQMYIGMGKSIVSTPCRIAEYDTWAWKQFPEVLGCFIYLWMNHESIIGRCNEMCSKCIVIDGHQKCRRRICAYKDVTVETEEMKNLVVGCCRTPMSNNKYCNVHGNLLNSNVIVSSETDDSNKKSLKRLQASKKGKEKEKNIKLNATSCKTGKERSDRYIKICKRSFGLIALIFNCKIICGFSELFRSETLKEIINLFCSCIRVSGRLAPTLVYDDGCHLVAYIRNHVERDLIRTNALNLLATTPTSVDRMHFKNHVGTFCRLEMNPDNNRLLDNINTEAAEQCFSWLRKYASIVSSMNWLRAPIYLLILFHYKNLSYVNRKPSDIFSVHHLVPKIANISLCHSADMIIETKKVNTTTANPKKTNNTAVIVPLELPSSSTNWELQIRLLNTNLNS